MSGLPSPPQHLLSRLSHPHYHLNSLLTLPFPVLLLARSPSSPLLSSALLGAPVLIALGAAARGVTDNIESLHETTTFQLRLFNLIGLVCTRNLLGFGKRWVAVYVVAWLLTTFFFPQPPYLGPSLLQELTTQEFDTQVLLLPTAHDAASAFASAPLSELNRIVDLDGETTMGGQKKPVELGDPKKWNLVLFHADFMAKSRELEMTLSRLSAIYTSPLLSFSFLTPHNAPTTFYDLDLSSSPTSLDLPLLRLYRGGKVVQQAPLGEEGAKAALKAERAETARVDKEKGKKGAKEGGKGAGARRRRSRKLAGGAGPAPRVEGEGEGEDGEESETDSEDEREVVKRIAMSRYQWDRSAAKIVEEFGLEERSGVGIVKRREKQ